MHLLDTFTTLQSTLQCAEQHGRIIPDPGAERFRFLAFAEIDLVPVVRRLTTLLQQAGLAARAVVELDQDGPWFGVFLDDTWTRGLFLQPHDHASMRLTVRLGGDPPVEEPHELPYHRCTRRTFTFALARSIERLLNQPRSNTPRPCQTHHA